MGTSYERLITEQLQKLGWPVVSSARYVQLLPAERNRDGSQLFDPFTGARSGGNLQAIRERALVKLLAEDEPVDAIVYADVVQVSAPHELEDAKWDGVQQNADHFGPWKRSFFRLAELPTVGRMPARSLGVVLADRTSQPLYVNRGGIQPLRQVIARKLEPVPKAQLFNSTERDAIAVRIAPRPLLLTPEALDAELNPGKAKKERKAQGGK